MMIDIPDNGCSMFNFPPDLLLRFGLYSLEGIFLLGVDGPIFLLLKIVNMPNNKRSWAIRLDKGLYFVLKFTTRQDDTIVNVVVYFYTFHSGIVGAVIFVLG